MDDIKYLLEYLKNLPLNDKVEFSEDFNGDDYYSALGQLEKRVTDLSGLFPIKAKHKLFGEVELVGMRCQADDRDNTMYLVISDREELWIYAHETEIL